LVWRLSSNPEAFGILFWIPFPSVLRRETPRPDFINAYINTAWSRPRFHFLTHLDREYFKKRSNRVLLEFDPVCTFERNASGI
ncbi:unnamed protein product, partial [Larinioides sclopetarius]